MGEISFVITGSILFAIGMTVFKTWASIPANSDIKWMLDHSGRVDNLKFMQVTIDVISFFTLGILIGLLYKTFLANHQTISLAGIAVLMALTCILLGNFAIGKINTICIVDKSADNISKCVILIIWILLFSNILDIIPVFETKTFDQIISSLNWYIYQSIFFGAVIALILVLKSCCIHRLRSMSNEIDFFIEKHFNYYDATSFVRNIVYVSYNMLDENNLKTIREVIKARLLSKIVEKMLENNSCGKYYHKSRIHNFFFLGIFTAFPVCAIVCTDRLLRTILESALLIGNRQSLALIQCLCSTKKTAEIGLSCQKYAKNMKMKGKIIKCDSNQELVVKLALYLPLPFKKEIINISGKHLLWVQP